EYKEYVEKVKPIAEKFGGEYIVRGGNPIALEGDEDSLRHVVIAFPSVEKAKEFYHSDEYQAIIGIRHAHSKGTLTLVEAYQG
ncbi:MAG TPA: DUF1330 domain-containing protein, partial [Alphaproteobacteria bacterium]|nr:DUF1330 domain-containing protein [Alphaproteobacteria bacterium]